MHVLTLCICEHCNHTPRQSLTEQSGKHVCVQFTLADQQLGSLASVAWMQAWLEKAEHSLMSNLPIASGSAGSAPNEPRESEFSLQRIASTMEIIDPRDITLVKFLGSGGYGEVHLGKWHSSEAAIKCLNPSLFFQVMYIH